MALRTRQASFLVCLVGEIAALSRYRLRRGTAGARVTGGAVEGVDHAVMAVVTARATAKGDATVLLHGCVTLGAREPGALHVGGVVELAASERPLLFADTEVALQAAVLGQFRPKVQFGDGVG